MKDFLLRMVLAGGIMGVIDAVWLMVVANKFYKNEIGSLLLEKPNLVAAAIFYIIFIVGIVAFVISPALEKQLWQHALGYGALFGLVAYATYDLTNLATIKGFSLKVVLVDLAWGMFISAIVSVATYAAVRAWFS